MLFKLLKTYRVEQPLCVKYLLENDTMTVFTQHISCVSCLQVI